MSTSDYPNSPKSASPSSEKAELEAVDRAKREIQSLLQEVSDLSKSDIESAEFFAAMLDKTVAALAAMGGAVWTVGDSGGLELAYQIGLRNTGLAENEVSQKQHGRLLQKVFMSDEGVLVAPHSGFADASADDTEAPANPTDFLLIMAPVRNDQGPQGVVELFQRPGARTVIQRGYLRFVTRCCDLAGDFLKGKRLRHLVDKQSLWEQLESFTRLAHETLDCRQTAYTIANEGRRLIGCDRVSIGIQKGRKCPIEAISGQDTFDKRSNVISKLGRLARTVTKTGEPIWYTGDTSDFAPQVEKALNDYVDESHTKSLAILPLLEKEEAPDPDNPHAKPKVPVVIGALIVEQMVSNQTPDGFKKRIEVVKDHSQTALANAREHEGLFLMPLWKMLGKAMWIFRDRTLPKTLGIMTFITATVLALIFVQAEFKLKGSGKIQPEIRSNVFAAVSGMIKEINVKHNDHVKKGDVLIIQQSLVIDKSILQLIGEADEARTELHAIRVRGTTDDNLNDTEKAQNAARINQLKQKLLSLQSQQEILDLQKKMLTIISPIDGVITTWNIKKTLENRPVGEGMQLLQVADPDSDWEIELLMPETRMSHITQAIKDSETPLKVRFILASHPGIEHLGTIKEVKTTAEVHGEKGNTVLIRVSYDHKKLIHDIPNPKSGAEVIAYIHCGKRAIGYVWLHDLFDFVNREIIFRF